MSKGRWLIDSLHGRLLLALALSAILPLAMNGLVKQRLDQREFQDLAGRQLEGLALGLAGELGLRFDSMLRDAHTVAALSEMVVATQPAQVQLTLNQLYVSYASFSQIGVFGLDKHPLAMVPAHQVITFEPEAFERAITLGEQQWRLMNTDEANQHLAVFSPIRNAERHVIAITVAIVNFWDFAAPLRSLRFGSYGRAFILDSNGRVVFHSADDISLDKQYTQLVALLGGRVAGVGTTQYNLAGAPWMAGYAPVSRYGWSAFVERPEESILAPVQQAYTITLITLLTVGVLALPTALLLTRTLIRPIQDLANATRAFTAGDPSAPLPTTAATEEIATLVLAFAVMRETVAHREQALRDSQQRLALHQQQTPLAMIEWDTNLQIVSWNHSAEQMFGFTPCEVMGRRLAHLILSAEEIVQMARPWEDTLAAGATQGTPYHHRTKAGQELICEWHTTKLVDNDQQVIGVAAVAQDITARTRTEEKLRLMDLVVANMTDAVLICEAGSIDFPGPRIVYTNETFTRMTGYTQAEVLGKTPRLLQGPQTDRLQLDYIRHNLAQWQGARAELINYRKDRSEFWIESTILPLRDAQNRISHWVAVQRDISERKAMEESLVAERALLTQRVQERTAELQSANQQLSQALRMKDEFMASMSHELRTPLNAILGITEALQECIFGPLTERQLKSLRTVEESGRHLLAVINDILDLSKIEAGKFDVELVPVQLQAVCQTSLQLMGPAAAKKHIQLHCHLPAEKSYVAADERRLKQVLVNLLSNAFKFTPQDGTVGLEMVVEPPGTQVVLTVWDTGIGIDKRNFHRIFQPFVQVDSTLARSYEGTGLGLSLAQHMIQFFGGTLTVDSTVGVGSRFTICLPLSQ